MGTGALLAGGLSIPANAGTLGVVVRVGIGFVVAAVIARLSATWSRTSCCSSFCLELAPGSD
jgi:hypothetical protein